jgi:hypothetical protein
MKYPCCVKVGLYKNYMAESTPELWSTDSCRRKADCCELRYIHVVFYVPLMFMFM